MAVPVKKKIEPPAVPVGIIILQFIGFIIGVSVAYGLIWSAGSYLYYTPPSQFFYPFILKFYTLLNIQNYIHFIYPSAIHTQLHWILNFLPCPFISGLIFAFIGRVIGIIFLIKPKRTLSDDPHYSIRTRGVDTPELDHIIDIAYICPEFDLDGIRNDFIQARQDMTAPEVKAVDLDDLPTPKQVIEYNEN